MGDDHLREELHKGLLFNFTHSTVCNSLDRVGKTELCKALAAYMFDTEEAMVGAEDFHKTLVVH